MDKKNCSLVLELCKFMNPNTDKIRELIAAKPDMAYVLGSLLFNRMGGVAYYTLKSYELLSSTNREFRNTLESIYISNRDKTAAYKKALADISLMLADMPVRYALLKGAYLCSVYPVGLRTSNDIDVLINKEDAGVVSKRLLDHGFQQGHIKNGCFVPATRAEVIASKMNRGEAVPFVLETGDVHMPYLEIDLNFSLDFQAKEGTDNVREMLETTVDDIVTPKNRLYTLCPEDFIAHLCAHLYKEATTYPWVAMGRDLSLYKFSDLYLLYMNHRLISDRLVSRIKQLGLEKESYYSLKNMCLLYDIQDDELDRLLSLVVPEDVSFMKKIYRPENKTYYEYDMDYISWFFHPNRADQLREVSCV